MGTEDPRFLSLQLARIFDYHCNVEGNSSKTEARDDIFVYRVAHKNHKNSSFEQNGLLLHLGPSVHDRTKVISVVGRHPSLDT